MLRTDTSIIVRKKGTLPNVIKPSNSPLNKLQFMLDLNNKKDDKNEPTFLSYERAGVIADRNQNI